MSEPAFLVCMMMGGGCAIRGQKGHFVKYMKLLAICIYVRMARAGMVHLVKTRGGVRLDRIKRGGHYAREVGTFLRQRQVDTSARTGQER